MRRSTVLKLPPQFVFPVSTLTIAISLNRLINETTPSFLLMLVLLRVHHKYIGSERRHTAHLPFRPTFIFGPYTLLAHLPFWPTCLVCAC